MEEEKFDVIIVGGGMAGSTAALLLARAGLAVLIIERGSYAGAKNMTGGRLYAHSLEKIIPGFARTAPIERRVAKERISLMTEKGMTSVEYSGETLTRSGADSYIVLRSVFDRWLMEQAEDAGAVALTGICVDDFIRIDGKIAGIKAAGEEMFVDVVILADGANSLLTEKCGLRKNRITPHEIAVGAKEVIGLDAKTVEERFNLLPGEGMSWLFAGYPSAGSIGGGFLYTNKESVSLGVVVTLSEFIKQKKSLHEMLEDFKNHPAVVPMIAEGRLLEYSAHMVPEAGYSMIPDLYGDGVLVIGDAAGLVINAGYTVRGMDLAVGSAEAAAKAVIMAKTAGCFLSSSLCEYKKLLEESFVLKEMKHFRRFPAFMDNHRIFGVYPRMAEKVMSNIFVVDGGTPKSMLKKIYAPVKDAGIFNLIKDGINGVRAL